MTHLVLGLLFLSLTHAFTIDPDTNRTVCEIVQDKGYGCELHYITTSDGFILQAERISSSRAAPAPSRPAVVMVPGVLCTTIMFVLGYEANLPYFLADSGLDVWMVNQRNRPDPPPKRHVSVDWDSAGAWNWTFEDIGTRDVPAMITYVLAVTNLPKISAYIGYSQGGVVGWVTYSMDPVIANLTDVFISLGGPAGPTSTASIAKPNTPAASHMDRLGSLPPQSLTSPPACPPCSSLTAFHDRCCIGDFPKLDPFAPLAKVAIDLCAISPEFCFDMMRGAALAPTDCQNANWTSHPSLAQNLRDGQHCVNGSRIQLMVANYPSWTSGRNVLHLQQINTAFRRFDWGEAGNLQMYGTPQPPFYPISKMLTKVAMFYGLYDILSGPQKVAEFLLDIPQDLLVAANAYPVGHLDYVLSNNPFDPIWNDILQVIIQHSTVPLVMAAA
eukprot:TRINITY_DN3493_c0_g1_i2.p1 TRINITY_DN3493_c0_g1~~TRINITY_DN3493_c0_g1_i2.p1  ORF type:complete len:443 (+),score=89.12 TRINITY_DN3493_c0_g1_i2:85-1413(+)